MAHPILRGFLFLGYTIDYNLYEIFLSCDLLGSGGGDGQLLKTLRFTGVHVKAPSQVAIIESPSYL